MIMSACCFLLTENRSLSQISYAMAAVSSFFNSGLFILGAPTCLLLEFPENKYYSVAVTAEIFFFIYF